MINAHRSICFKLALILSKHFSQTQAHYPCVCLCSRRLSTWIIASMCNLPHHTHTHTHTHTVTNTHPWMLSITHSHPSRLMCLWGLKCVTANLSCLSSKASRFPVDPHRRDSLKPPA